MKKKLLAMLLAVVMVCGVAGCGKEVFLMKVTKDMTIGELLMADRGAGMILMQNGMHCVGCPSAAGETLEEASMVHGMDCDKLVTELNAYLEAK